MIKPAKSPVYYLAVATCAANLTGGALLASSLAAKDSTKQVARGAIGISGHNKATSLHRIGFLFIAAGTTLGSVTRLSTAVKDRQPTWALASVWRILLAPILAAKGELLEVRSLINSVADFLTGAGYSQQLAVKNKDKDQRRFNASYRDIKAVLRHVLGDLKVCVLVLASPAALKSEMHRVLVKPFSTPKGTNSKVLPSPKIFQFGSLLSSTSGLVLVAGALNDSLPMVASASVLSTLANYSNLLDRYCVATTMEGSVAQTMKYIGLPLSVVGSLFGFTTWGYGLSTIGLALSENLKLIIWNRLNSPASHASPDSAHKT